MTTTTARKPRRHVLRDLDHPDFPHGTTTGYSRKCRRECCLRAERLSDKQREVNRGRGIEPFAHRVPEPMRKKAQAHLLDLLENHSASTTVLARRAGAGFATIIAARDGKAMSKRTYDRIMALKPEGELRRDQIDPTLTLLRIGQMQALGYPMSWQEEQTGLAQRALVAATGLIRRGKQKWVAADTANGIEALSRAVGDRPADTERDGIRPHDITRAKTVARRNGYYPPVFYDADGTLDYRAIPEHPWTVIEESCHEHIERLELALRHPDLGAAGLTSLALDYTSDAHPDSTPEHTEFVRVEMAFRRLLEGLGIRAIDGGREKRAELHEALWRFMRRGEGDPVSFCINNGIISARSVKIPSDHPAVAEQRAEEAKARAEARQESRKASRRTEQGRAAHNQQQQARRDRMTPEEREAYNERKRLASQRRRNAARANRDTAKAAA